LIAMMLRLRSADVITMLGGISASRGLDDIFYTFRPLCTALRDDVSRRLCGPAELRACTQRARAHYRYATGMIDKNGAAEPATASTGVAVEGGADLRLRKKKSQHCRKARARGLSSTMAARIFAVAIPSAVGFAYLERYVLSSVVPFLYTPAPLLGGAISRAVGVPLLLTCLACFWLTLHGFAVGSARAKYRELARKDDEKDVDARCEWRAPAPRAPASAARAWPVSRGPTNPRTHHHLPPAAHFPPAPLHRRPAEPVRGRRLQARARVQLRAAQPPAGF
jgi:hypothetical protein